MNLRDLPDSPPVFSRARHRRDPAVWASARNDYLAGEAAPVVCERHGLGLSTFRDRAREEGWRREDQPAAPAPPAWTEADEAALETDPAAMADAAWRRAARAVAQGRPHEARVWTRLAAELRARAAVARTSDESDESDESDASGNATETPR